MTFKPPSQSLTDSPIPCTSLGVCCVLGITQGAEERRESTAPGPIQCIVQFDNQI